MPSRSSSTRRPFGCLAAAALAVVLALAGCAVSETTTARSDETPPEPSGGNTPIATDAGNEGDDTDRSAAAGGDGLDAAAQPPATATAGALDQSAGGRPPAEFPTGIVPVRIEIPAIDVDAPVIALDLRGDAPEVPADFADSGWYEQTRLPGEIGPAVIAGHVDSVEGPAVFAGLGLLEPGDEITVTGADGGQRRFVVAATGQYPKTDLPDEVFGFGQPVPELRLITCGGVFDRSVRHYVDNVVVYAVSNSQSPSAL